jgi:hypothetical protein
VVEGERDKLAEADESARNTRNETATTEIEVDEVTKGEEGMERYADYIAQYGSPGVKHLDGELLDALVNEGAEPVVGGFSSAG